jgi:hypothetical protein
MAMATSNRRGPRALTVAAVVAAMVIAVVAFTRSGRPPARTFPVLHPAAAPAGWRQLTLPGGTAMLAYPPSMRPLAGDKDAVSAARLSPHGAFELYLNATPRQGAERPRHWATFRLRLLRSDDAASAHEDAAMRDVTFHGGTGSCVIDDYITRIGRHHYEEIACLVQGRTSASVIVAASPAAAWARAHPLLFRAVAAYIVH